MNHRLLELNSFIRPINNIKNSIVALIFIGASMLFFSCKSDLKKIKESSETLNMPSTSASNYEITYYDSTRMRYRFSTPEANDFSDKKEPYQEFPQGFNIEKYDQDKKIVSSLRGDYGKFYKKEKRWEAIGNVVSVNDRGDTLCTDKLFWLEKEERIYTDVFVRIIQEDKEIRGIGLEADQEFKNWTILKPTGTIYIDLEE